MLIRLASWGSWSVISDSRIRCPSDFYCLRILLLLSAQAMAASSMPNTGSSGAHDGAARTTTRSASLAPQSGAQRSVGGTHNSMNTIIAVSLVQPAEEVAINGFATFLTGLMESFRRMGEGTPSAGTGPAPAGSLLDQLCTICDERAYYEAPADMLDKAQLPQFLCEFLQGYLQGLPDVPALVGHTLVYFCRLVRQIKRVHPYQLRVLLAGCLKLSVDMIVDPSADLPRFSWLHRVQAPVLVMPGAGTSPATYAPGLPGFTAATFVQLQRIILQLLEYRAQLNHRAVVGAVLEICNQYNHDGRRSEDITAMKERMSRCMLTGEQAGRRLQLQREALQLPQLARLPRVRTAGATGDGMRATP